MNNGIYDNMKFPPHEYRPFPKYAKLSDGREQNCADAEELAAFLALDPANESKDVSAEAEPKRRGRGAETA